MTTVPTTVSSVLRISLPTACAMSTSECRGSMSATVESGCVHSLSPIPPIGERTALAVVEVNQVVQQSARFAG
ncbi:hypothetical protein [Mycobacterium sp. NPDC050853]|uniref:hypothetical protein n=1 Tax=Mycobacterium sp. NPDC050853 TaxID=3155160 RepID=UPI003403C177